MVYQYNVSRCISCLVRIFVTGACFLVFCGAGGSLACDQALQEWSCPNCYVVLKKYSGVCIAISVKLKKPTT